MIKLTDEDRRQMPRAERIELFLAEAKRLTDRPDGDFVQRLNAMRALLTEAQELLAKPAELPSAAGPNAAFAAAETIVAMFGSARPPSLGRRGRPLR
jgi:hypothetical protein